MIFQEPFTDNQGNIIHYKNAKQLMGHIRYDGHLINAGFENSVNFHLEEDLKNVRMICNIHRQNALSHWLAGKYVQSKLHEASIIDYEKQIESLTRIYQETRKNQDVHICACGATGDQETVTWDPIFKQWICLDCQIAYELDE